MPEEKSWLDIPRYKENPIYMFFECFILDVLECLPEEDYKWIENLNLKDVFKTKASDWREVIKETLNLSDTINAAIWHLWVRNCNSYYDSHEGHVAYAQYFTDNFMEDDSQVDVWTQESYDDALKQVENFKREKGQALSADAKGRAAEAQR